MTEAISDDPSPGRGIKAVSHVKVETTAVGGSFTLYGDTINGNYNTYTGFGASWNQWEIPTAGVFRLGTPARSSIAVRPTVSRDALIRDTVDAFFNDNQTDNLLNLIESPQLIHSLISLRSSVNELGHHITKYGLLNTVANMRRKLGKARTNTLLKRIPKRIGRGASNLYLEYSFGVGPVISDMKKVQSAMKTIRQKLQEELKRGRRRLVSVHRSGGYTISYQSSTFVDYGSTHTFGNVKYSIRLDNDTKQVCTVRGYKAPLNNIAALRQADYLLSKFGVTGPASLAWELVPWSFVVDWFIDLRHITNTLDNLLTGNEKRIVDICISDKISFTQTALLNETGYNPANNGDLMGIVKTREYTREPVSSYQKIGLSGRFGKKQASLTAALLYQQVANLASNR
jgi:hypothetical protein